MSWYRRNIHPFTHPDSQPSFICVLHLLRSTASNCSIYMLDRLFPHLSPSPLWCTSWSETLHFILHIFLHQSLSSFCSTCPYHCNLFRCSTEIVSSNPSLSLNLLLGTLSCSLMPFSSLPSEVPHHFLFLQARFTSMQHTTSQTTAV